MRSRVGWFDTELEPMGGQYLGRSPVPGGQPTTSKGVCYLTAQSWHRNMVLTAVLSTHTAIMCKSEKVLFLFVHRLSRPVTATSQSRRVQGEPRHFPAARRRCQAHRGVRLATTIQRRQGERVVVLVQPLGCHRCTATVMRLVTTVITSSDSSSRTGKQASWGRRHPGRSQERARGWS